MDGLPANRIATGILPDLSTTLTERAALDYEVDPD